MDWEKAEIGRRKAEELLTGTDISQGASVVVALVSLTLAQRLFRPPPSDFLLHDEPGLDTTLPTRTAEEPKNGLSELP